MPQNPKIGVAKPPELMARIDKPDSWNRTTVTAANRPEERRKPYRNGFARSPANGIWMSANSGRMLLTRAWIRWRDPL